MNAITPPKEMPSFHNTAARGTFPTKHTSEMMTMNGATIGPENFENSGGELKKNDRRKSPEQTPPTPRQSADRFCHPTRGNSGTGTATT
jgi:hypothetical protein